MKAAAWMIGTSVGSWLAAAALVDRAMRVDVLLGMLGPLAIVSATWVLMERAYARDPRQLTALMMKAFAAKMVLFGAYVAVMIGLLSRRPVPFVASFTAYFIALYLCEAILLRRLSNVR